MSILRDYAATVTNPSPSQPRLPFGVEGQDGTGPTEAGTGSGVRFDEVIAQDGNLREAWRPLAETALGLTREDLSRMGAEIGRFLADDGVTYYRRDTGAQPWQLDPFPLILDRPTWDKLEVGLAQRAELLDALLTDLYGERSVLRSGVLPSAAVYGHPGFLRPLSQPGSREMAPLVLTGTDLGRDSHGEWRVLADRVQAPSGLGFAAENRRVISQVLPQLHYEHPVHRMGPYLSALRSGLVESAPEGVNFPRIVVLTPGPRSETAFDQAYLASALGFPMVQGNDLVVHEGAVWIRPSGWPDREPKFKVDVILRRVDADFCDPLELRGDSQLGVAGLTECMRRGTVRIANGLGSGVLENPALLPYLPAVSEHLLGEQLRLDQVPTLWCGDPESRRQVEARVIAGDETLVVRSVDRSRKALAERPREEILARIAAAPYRFVGQELLPLSQAPVWDGDHSTSRDLLFRAFTVRLGTAYRPLSGGLATVRANPDAAPVTKDVWVLKSTVNEADHGLAEVTRGTTARTEPEFTPRALEDMFWAGRYAERAEAMLRLVLATQEQLGANDRHFGNSTTAAGPQLLLDAIHSLVGGLWTDPDQEFRSLLLDADRVGSVAHSLTMMRSSLEGVRDQLSLDTWRVFSSVDRAADALRAFNHERLTGESSARMLTALLAFQGIVTNMMRDDGWHMLQVGQALERAQQVSRLLAATATRAEARGEIGSGLLTRDERRALEGILTAAESVVTYRRRYRGVMRIPDALDLLVSDRANPRSIAASLVRAQESLAAMPTSTGSTRPERLVDDMLRALEPLEHDVVGGVQEHRGQSVAEFINDGIASLNALGLAIDAHYFEAGPTPLPFNALLGPVTSGPAAPASGSSASGPPSSGRPGPGLPGNPTGGISA
ncbi:MAG: circularly permuted type 2 ATP-grasp protein [Galactobacter sp.]